MALGSVHDAPLKRSFSEARAWLGGRRRRAAGAGTLAALAAVAFTLTSNQWGVPFGGSSSGPLSHYTDGGFSFSYPAGWHTSGGWVATMGETGIVYLSTERLQPSCKTFHHANGDATGGACGGDLVLPGVLSPDGVLVAWTGHFGPTGGFQYLTGSNTRIGGHPARITVNQSDCFAWQADASTTAYIAANKSSANGPWYQMDACMRGPRLGRVKGQVQAMLRSVSFQSPAR